MAQSVHFTVLSLVFSSLHLVQGVALLAQLGQAMLVHVAFLTAQVTQSAWAILQVAHSPPATLHCGHSIFAAHFSQHGLPISTHLGQAAIISCCMHAAQGTGFALGTAAFTASLAAHTLQASPWSAFEEFD